MPTTTTIGAYPKPESVAVETWFGDRTRRPSEGYDAARLWAAPDCALVMLPRELARRKRHNFCAAARALG